MKLNLTNLKDLEHICGLAADYFERTYGLELEDVWIGRARLYRDLFRAEIAQWDSPQPFPEMVVDPNRSGLLSHIPVRARLPDGRYGTADLAQLTKESFFAWLRSRGGKNEWAENTVAALLGYDVE